MHHASATRLAVLGATGRVGRLVIAEALRRGASVAAPVRDPRRVDPAAAADPRVTVTAADLDDVPAMSTALRGADAVVVAAGVRYRKGHPWSPIDGRPDVAPAAVRAALAAGAPHVVLLSAYGVGDSWADLPAVARLILRTSSLPAAYAALAEAENLLAAGAVRSTVVRAVTLSDAPATGRDIGTGGLRGNPKVSREDVARWLVDAALSPAGAAGPAGSPAGSPDAAHRVLVGV